MSFLLKTAKNKKNIKKRLPDELVEKTSAFVKLIVDHASDDDIDIETTVVKFCHMARFSQEVFFNKNTAPKSVEMARDYADAYDYYMESLKEVSTLVESMLVEKYKGLLPNGAVQKIVTYASEQKKFSDKKIIKYLSSMIPKPRRETRDMRGASRGSN